MLKCKDCEVLMINGVRCHETGCPSKEANKKKCAACGLNFTQEYQGQRYCHRHWRFQ